jgi:hypothetical protein
MQTVSYIFTATTVVLIIIMLCTFRKVRSMSVKTPLMSIAVGLVGFVVYKAIIGTSISAQLLWVLAVFGALLGMWQGKKTMVWVEDGKRKAQNTAWFIVVWLIGFGFNQMLVVTGQALCMNLGIGALSLSTGVTVGAQGMLFIKLATARPGETVRCINCGSVNRPRRGNCAKCGKAVVAPFKTQPAAQMAASRCPKCGASSSSLHDFCSQCGQKLSVVVGPQSPSATHIQKTTPKKTFRRWWVFAFIPVIGIIVVWTTLRKEDPPLANRIFIVNFGLTMILLYGIYQMLI